MTSRHIRVIILQNWMKKTVIMCNYCIVLGIHNELDNYSRTLRLEFYKACHKVKTKAELKHIPKGLTKKHIL